MNIIDIVIINSSYKDFVHKLFGYSEITITPAAINDEIRLLKSFSGENQDLCVLRSIKHVSGMFKIC